MKKRNKYLRAGAAPLASTPFLVACSNNSNSSTHTSSAQENPFPDKGKELSIGNYLNQSKTHS